MFGLFYAIPVTLLFLVPIGLCGVYFVKAIVLYRIGQKENSSFKKQSAVRTFLAVSVGFILLVIVWMVLMIWIFPRTDYASYQEPASRLWLPSQYGLLAEAPQRHKATLPSFFSSLPSGYFIVNEPFSNSGPFA